MPKNLWAAVALLGLALGPVASAQSERGSGAAGATHPFIDEFDFRGETRFSDAQLREVLKQHVHDMLSQSGLRADMRAIRALYKTPGGVSATVSPNITHPGPGHVVVEYIIKESN